MMLRILVVVIISLAVTDAYVSNSRRMAALSKLKAANGDTKDISIDENLVSLISRLMQKRADVKKAHPTKRESNNGSETEIEQASEVETNAMEQLKGKNFGSFHGLADAIEDVLNIQALMIEFGINNFIFQTFLGTEEGKFNLTAEIGHALETAKKLQTLQSDHFEADLNGNPVGK
ncbi:uncharacterized protein LOC132556567 isoform X2 [Ylistrum balloti]|uniref:uncharacterized protein LOC132556567 isoform X2 n=1 Tax=Ylistrum balloti TaxID=509963 RepID=UPI002905C4CA|nr:uncharacterized protein LOC132556567 isoform X2 [Ylistrum balloti]